MTIYLDEVHGGVFDVVIHKTSEIIIFTIANITQCTFVTMRP